MLNHQKNVGKGNFGDFIQVIYTPWELTISTINMGRSIKYLYKCCVIFLIVKKKAKNIVKYDQLSVGWFTVFKT